MKILFESIKDTFDELPALHVTAVGEMELVPDIIKLLMLVKACRIDSCSELVKTLIQVFKLIHVNPLTRALSPGMGSSLHFLKIYYILWNWISLHLQYGHIALNSVH